MVTAIFNPDSTTSNVYGLWQYDYGQTLRIQGLHLPSAVEIHFSLQETGGTSVSRVGITKDGVTDVVIPDSMLQNDGAASDYDIFVFVYLTDDTSGQTEYKIKLRVKSRPEPEVPSGGEEPDIFHEAVQKVKESADKAAESEKQAEGWAHGREDLPERAQDNAKYYSDQAAADAKKTGADRKEVERLVESVSGIDEQVAKVENLTKQAQTSATNAALSEQAAKTAETNAQTAQAGAETAEGNAELAEQGAKASEQAVEKAKQLVTQMEQDVLNNKNHVDQAVQEFALTTQQALVDVNNAGQTQTDRIQGAGNTVVESVKTAQGTATQAVETAKSEAVQAVQTEGTTQTGNVTAEGEKQIQAVQTAAQEIIADREQIQSNKEDIADLRQNKAGAIVETASGKMIQAEDSAVAGFEGMRIFGKSTQEGVPSPENPVPIESAGDDGEIKCNVNGKNICSSHQKDITWNQYIAALYVEAELKPNTVYTFSYNSKSTGNSFYINENIAKEFRTFDERGERTAQTFTTKDILDKNDTKQYSPGRGWIFLKNNKDNVPVEFSDIQIEENSTATSYAPYTPTQILTLQTPKGLPGIPVDSGGNYTDENGQQWVCDEIDFKRGKYVQRIKEFIIDQNKKLDLNLGKYGAPEKNTILVRAIDKSIKKRGAILCRELPHIENWLTEIESVHTTETSIDFRLSRERLGLGAETTVEENKAAVLKFLETNPPHCLTELNDPIETDLPPEVIEAYKQLHTNYPTTVLTNDSGAGMELTYIADTKTYVDTKIAGICTAIVKGV